MPTRIFHPWPSEETELCHPIREEDFETITVRINGEPQAASWRPIAMRIIREDQGRVFTHADAPWFGDDALILRPNAIVAMEPLLSNSGEVLPLICEGAAISVFNPFRLEDALDEAASTIKRFTDGGIMIIDRYVFRPDVVGGVDAFKIFDVRASSTFVSEAFVTRWTNAGLRGVFFLEVWPNAEKWSPVDAPSCWAGHKV